MPGPHLCCLASCFIIIYTTVKYLILKSDWSEVLLWMSHIRSHVSIFNTSSCNINTFIVAIVTAGLIIETGCSSLSKANNKVILNKI